MSVMPETSQSTMGPYVASAESTSALYASTAVSREALVVKMLSSRRRWWMGGTPLPTVAAPVQKTASAPRRMRMRKFIARSAAWWLRWGTSSGHRMLAARVKRARGWCSRREVKVMVSREMLGLGVRQSWLWGRT